MTRGATQGYGVAPGQGRDPRLDFFRGSAMFIIYIAHCRGNVLWHYIREPPASPIAAGSS